MKTIVVLLIGAAALLVTAGCEEEGHEHHHAGGAYDGTYQQYGHEQRPVNSPGDGYWQRGDDWHEH